jgi:nucleoside-diphosphate-sugar epimerase
VILVTGPTGNIGRHIASHLLHPGAAVRASTSSIEQQIDPTILQIVPKPAA